jgi:predicted HD superfamily hydrolase involved in NAD metabolism
MIQPAQLPHGLGRYVGAVPITGDVQATMVALLTSHRQSHVVGHSLHVAAEARRLATCYELDVGAAEVAGWLHDISAIVPNDERIALAEGLGLDVLPEERAVPMIVHQKLSASIAELVFGIDDPAVLSAIGCHTTLKAGASPLDMAVFVADKIRWDQPGDPPYLEAILAAVERSLPAAAFCYLDYLWKRRETLLVIHPWLAQAHQQLGAQLCVSEKS